MTLAQNPRPEHTPRTRSREAPGPEPKTQDKKLDPALEDKTKPMVVLPKECFS